MPSRRLLKEADLIIGARKERERWNTPKPLPIKHVDDRWIGPQAAHAVALLDWLKHDFEG